MSGRVPLVARYTWVRMWPASACFGGAMGIVWLADFAVKRSLGAPEVIVPLLMSMLQLPWIFAPAYEPLLARIAPNVAFRRIGWLAAPPLLLIAFVGVTPLAGEPGRGDGQLALFFVLMCLHTAVSTAYVPHRGGLLTANFPQWVRGRYYGMLTAVTILASVVTSKLGGLLLDADPRWLRALFPAAGLLAFAGMMQLGRIRWRGWKRAASRRRIGPDGALHAFLDTWRRAGGILRRDKTFRTYEIGFMLYGFGFLMVVPLVVIHAEQTLGLSYDQWTWARGFAFPVGMIIAAAFAGRLCDLVGVVRTTASAFLSLAVVFGCLPLVTSAQGLIIAYAAFGIIMSAVDLGWSLGPLHFAPKDQARTYMAIHFSLVGVRSLFAPILGYALKTWFSFEVACLAAAGSVCVAAITVGAFVPRTKPPTAVSSS